MMPFPLGLCLNIEHSLNSQLLLSVSHILYLEAINQGFSLNCVFFKTRQTRYKRMTMMEKINIIILVMINCWLSNSTAIHTTMLSHVLKRFYC